jgi:hypothetical protein
MPFLMRISDGLFCKPISVQFVGTCRKQSGIQAKASAILIQWSWVLPLDLTGGFAVTPIKGLAMWPPILNSSHVWPWKLLWTVLKQFIKCCGLKEQAHCPPKANSKLHMHTHKTNTLQNTATKPVIKTAWWHSSSSSSNCSTGQLLTSASHFGLLYSQGDCVIIHNSFTTLVWAFRTKSTK